MEADHDKPTERTPEDFLKALAALMREHGVQLEMMAVATTKVAHAVLGICSPCLCGEGPEHFDWQVMMNFTRLTPDRIDRYVAEEAEAARKRGALIADEIAKRSAAPWN